MKTRTDLAFQWLGYTSTAALIFMALWLAFFEQPPLQYPTQPLPVISKKVYPGDPLVLSVRRISTELDESAYTGARWLVNVETGERTVLKPEPISVSSGDHTVISDRLIVPADLLSTQRPGRYYAAGSVPVDGAVRSFKVAWRTEEFEVIRPGAN